MRYDFRAASPSSTYILRRFPQAQWVARPADIGLVGTRRPNKRSSCRLSSQSAGSGNSTPTASASFTYHRGRRSGRIEQQRTIQKLLEKDDGSRPELAQALGSLRRGDNDLRRGMLLVASGLVWSATTFFIGGNAWIFGGVPVVIGIVYLLFWRMSAARS